MPWELDIAVIRRFERRVLLPLPKKEARIDILKSSAGVRSCHTNLIDLESDWLPRVRHEEPWTEG